MMALRARLGWTRLWLNLDGGVGDDIIEAPL
jgi:hypothetical protein